MTTPSLELVTGCMFSGKTDKLIRLLEQAQIANQRVIVFKPKKDTRNGNTIETRRGHCFEAIEIEEPRELFRFVVHEQVIGIDEAHFFPIELARVVHELIHHMKKRVIVAGLDLDYQGLPFETVAHLLAMATHVDKRTAICATCNGHATRSQRLHASRARELVGDLEYEARCLVCFDPEC